MELIGRDGEQLEVMDRLGQRRLVTLIGPAGVGKTALARAVAGRLAGTFERGAHFVDLTRVERPDAVAGAIAGQLGFASFEDLLDAPPDRAPFVVVDNCEHVTDAAADAIAELLGTGASRTVLATSRSPLGLAEESLVVLRPLAVPAAGDADGSSDAVRLFLERARDAGAPLAPEQLPAVVELCRQLDGLPLALELAAARARVLQPSEILRRLGDGRDVDVLARPRFRGDQRHRSLATTLDWSYRLLPDDVAALFERLGVLAGPFTGQLATAIAADVGVRGADAADALQLLVDSSLVVAEPAAGAMRFRLLHTMRTFAIARLAARGALDDARRRLAEHLTVLARDTLARTGGRRWAPAAFTQLLSLYDALADALRWCLAHDDEPSRALSLCSVLWGVVHQGPTEDVHALAEATIERWSDPSLPFATDAIATAATARCLVGDARAAFELAARALPHADASRTAPVTLRRAMAYAARARGDGALAQQLLGDVAALGRERGLLALALEADVTRAQLLADGGDLDAGIALAGAAHREAQAAGSVINEVWARSVEAHLMVRKDIAAGLPLVHDALATCRRIDYPVGISVNLRSLAWAAIRNGDHDAAATALAELFDGQVARGGLADVRGALQTTADLLRAVGEGAWASVAASSASLPLVGITFAKSDTGEAAANDGVPPLPRREAIALARRAVRRLLEAGPSETKSAASSSASTAPASASVWPEASASASAPAAAEPPSPTRRARIVDRGAYWELEFAGRAVSVKASKGIADLARLLRAPGTEVHCLDLMGAAAQQSSLGEAIDAAALRDYEQRIRDLQAEVDAAEADHDAGRAELARAELDALVDHLSAAVGLGGRGRLVGGSSERARSAVTQRIRSTIRRLGRDHPPLGRHLEASITTGIYCSYRPEQPVTWEHEPRFTT